MNTKIEYLYFPKNVQKLSLSSSFDQQTSLVHFDVDEHNPYFCSIDGVLFSKDKKILIHFPASKNVSIYTIPNTVNIVGHAGFIRLKYLKYVIIPDSVIEFKGYNFYLFNIQCIDVFRYPRQPKLKFGAGCFSFSTFQESNITYIYSSQEIVTCRNAFFTHKIFEITAFILMFE